MANSEEYLAALGFDTKDADKAVQQTVTLLGHLGAQFDEVSGKSERAERSLLGSGRAARSGASGFDSQTKSLKQANAEWDRQDKIYNDYLSNQEKMANGAQNADGNLSRLRYAVYDVSNALAVGGAAAAAFVGGIVGANVVYEREFANVRRTVGVTGNEADELYTKFLRLSTDIPVAFSQLTEIGALAGQLGIVEDRVASFTETTAQFAATTDVSVEASATAFGRLDQLIDGVEGRYDALASSILNVGINSVATESQIIGIASQIAATGNQAGLTADEIIGLAGSLASLGIAPEAARGTILRVFSQINSAVSQGGRALNDFATISGMSAAEFQSGWSTDFTTTFLAFLNGIDANGGNAEATIRSLGITATRDVNALLKLSQSTDAVSSNLALAAQGFGDTSVLAENFGVIAQTNAARLQVLVQTVQAFAATVGEATSGPLSYFIDYLQRLLDAAIQFADTDFGQGVAFFSTILGATLAVMLLVGAAATRTAGSFLALKTAIGETYLQTMLAQGGMRGFTATLFGAAGAASAFGAALKATGIGLLVTGALYLLGEAVAAIGKGMQSGAEQAEEYFGSLDGLAEAIKADNVQIFNARLREANDSMVDGQQKATTWVEALKAAAAAQQEVKDGTDEAATSIDGQTLRIGKNTQEWLRNQLASSEAFQQIFNDLSKLDSLTGQDEFTYNGTTVAYEAFDLEQYINIASTRGADAADQFWASWMSGLETKFQEQGEYNFIASEVFGQETLTAVQQSGQQIGNAVTEGMKQAASADAQNALLDAVLGPLEDGAEEAADTFKALVNDVYGVINAEAELSANTQKLGEDFATNGAQVASSGSAMQSVIASIYASSSGAPEAAARMQGLFDALVQGGFASASQLGSLQAVINGLSGGAAVNALPFQMGAFSNGLNKVAKSAGTKSGGAAKEIRTLVDYANDLRGVFSRAFDIRFGGAQAFDEISSGWLSIREGVASVNEEISKYNSEMQSLTADRAVREYWLSVAENYGDALRAGQLRAELAEIDNKLASTSGDLADAQAKGSKTLIGNSKAAIENREEVLGMVGSYQSYITALAAAGVPQAQLQATAAQLKQDFIAQATQLGYNTLELGTYAAAFDDVGTAIARVPRSITVTANTDPALQALNEFVARARASVASSPINIPVTTTFDADAPAKAGRAAVLLAQLASWQRQYATAIASGADNNAIRASEQISRISGILNSGSYRSGTSWTGSGNPWEVAGVVHNREAVLNERGTQMVPSQFVQAANQGRNPWQFAPQQGSSLKMPSTLTVELSPVDRDLLMQGKQVTVVLAGDTLAESTSASTSDDSRRGGG